MDFRAFVAKAPHLTKPRQRTLVYGGKLLFSNAAVKIPKAISQKRHDRFSFLNDENLDKCLSKKKIRLTTPALWLSSPHWPKCMTNSYPRRSPSKRHAKPLHSYVGAPSRACTEIQAQTDAQTFKDAFVWSDDKVELLLSRVNDVVDYRETSSGVDWDTVRLKHIVIRQVFPNVSKDVHHPSLQTPKSSSISPTTHIQTPMPANQQ